MKYFKLLINHILYISFYFVRLVAAFCRRFVPGFKKLPVLAQKLVSIILAITITITGTGLLTLIPNFTKSTQAVWFNDNWGYRQEVPVTSTNGSAQSNVFISFTLDTATLITAGKLQSSCDDIRITDQGGNLLPYHIGRTNACNASNTTIDFLLSSFPDLKSTYYVYYGNPNAISKDTGANFSQSQASNYSVGSLGTEVKASASRLYWKMDEGQGTTLNNSGNGGTGPKFIQSVNGYDDANVTFDDSAAFASNTTVGNSFIVAVSFDYSGNGSVVNITDSKSNTGWMAATPRKLDTRHTQAMQIFVLPAIKSGGASHTIRATTSGSEQIHRIIAFEVSGLDSNPATILDGYSTSETDSGTAVTAGAITTTTDNDYIFAAAMNDSSPGGTTIAPDSTANQVFTERDTARAGSNEMQAQDYIMTKAGSVTSNWTFSSTNDAIVASAAFKPAKLKGATNNNQIQYVQSKTKRVSGTTNSITFDTLPTAGNLIVVVCGLASTSISITDNQTGSPNTYSTATTVDFSGNHRIAYAKNVTVNLSTFTVTCTAGSSSNLSMAIFEYAGADTSSPLDQATNNTAFTTTSSTTGSITTTTNNDLVIAVTFANSNSITITPTYTGFTEREENENAGSTIFNVIDKVNASTGSYNATWTYGSNVNYAALIASFKPANTTQVWQTEDMCVSGKCLYFTGANNVNTSTGDSPTLDFVASDNFTVQAWVKRNGTSSATNYILTKADTTTGGYKLWMDDSGDLCFGVDDDATWTPDDSACTSAVDFDDSKWHLVTGVKSGTSSITLYVDGNQRAQDASIATTGTLANTNALYVGIDRDGTSNEWLGFIDEVKVYGEAKSAAQVASDFAARGINEGASSTLGTQINSTPGALNNGLVGYWKMDESAANTCTGGTNDNCDSSGNGNNAAWAGDATSSTGKFSNSTTLDGTGDYIDAGSPTTLDNIRTNGMTYSAWVNPNFATCTTSVFYHNVFFKTSGTGLYFYCNAASAFNVWFFSDTSGTDADSRATVSISNSNWYHIAAVYQENKIAKLYFNGKEVSTYALQTQGTGSETNDAAGSLNIGREISGSPQYFNGKIDEARVYNRPLSKDEIAQLANFAPGPTLYMKLDEGSGTTANNSAAENNGTISSATYTNGKYGKSLNFGGGGSNNNVRVTEYSAVDAAQSSSFTVSAWVKTTSAYDFSSTSGVIVAKDSGGASHWNLEFSSFNWVCFSITDGVGTTSCHSADTLRDGNWHYITGIRDTAADTVAIYIDGQLDTSNGDATTSFSNDSDISIGNGGSSYTAYDFGGQIDEVKYYNYARTPKQLVEDMNAGHPAPGSPVGSAVLYQKMDEGAENTCSGGTNDICNLGTSTTTLDGTLTSSSRTTAGKFGGAFDGDGTGKRIAVADSDNLDFIAAEDFSISGWFKSDSATNPANGPEYIINKRNGDGTNAIGYAVYATTGGLICFGHDDDTTSFPGDSACTTTDYYDGTWHYFLAKKTGTTRTDIYIDGRAAGSDTSISETGTLANTGSFYVGDMDTDNNATSGTEEFAGNADEIKVYRSALTDAQILADMNRGQGQQWGALSDKSGNQLNSADNEYCIPGDSSTCTGPFLRYDFEDKTASATFDTSGNGNNGTWSGTGTHYTPGKPGNAGKFNGTDDKVQSASDPLTNYTMTIEMWAKFPSLPGSTKNFAGSDGNSNWRLGINSGGTLQYLFGSGGSDTTSNTTLSANTWYHIAVTGNGSTAILYINGQRDGTAPIGTFNSNTVDFGSGSFGNQTFANVIIDNARVFRYQRSAAQIAWDYNKGGPVGYWRLDDCQGTSAIDSAGNSLTGTLALGASGTTTAGTCSTSSTAWGNGATGKRNYALDFDGTDDVVTASDNSIMDFTTDMTVAFWINQDTLRDQGFVSKWSTSGNNRSWLVESTGASFDNFRILVDGDGAAGGNCGVSSSGAALTTGTWYHLVVTFTGSTFYLYKNGVLNNSGASCISTLFNSAASFSMGALATPGNYFDGKLDDVRLYNYALTNNQVKQLYNNGALNFGPVTGAP